MNSTAAGFKNTLTVLYVLAGSICLMAAKMQNIQWVDQGGVHKRFFHPFMQTFMMFVGETLCLFIYWIMKSRNRKFYQAQAEKALTEGRRPAPKQYILIPAVCDLMASSLQYMSLNFMPASIYQMLKGGSIITTFLFSKWILGGTTKRSQISGCLLSLVGITIVGLSAVLFNHGSSTFTTENIIIGSVLMLISLVINGFQFAFEGRLFKNYYIEPMLMVGMQGVFGLVLSWCMAIGFMFIPCSFGNQACVLDKYGNPFLQRAEQYFFETINSGMLIGMTIVTVISIAVFNLIGLTIIKYINALARALLNLTKTAFIWVIGIVVTLTAGKHDSSYEWEILTWQILVMESVGFVFLIFATLIYNDNIYVKGFSTKRQIINVHEERQTLLTEQSVK